MKGRRAGRAQEAESASSERAGAALAVTWSARLEGKPRALAVGVSARRLVGRMGGRWARMSRTAEAALGPKFGWRSLRLPRHWQRLLGENVD